MELIFGERFISPWVFSVHKHRKECHISQTPHTSKQSSLFLSTPWACRHMPAPLLNFHILSVFLQFTAGPGSTFSYIFWPLLLLWIPLNRWYFFYSLPFSPVEAFLNIFTTFSLILSLSSSPAHFSPLFRPLMSHSSLGTHTAHQALSETKPCQ